MDYGPVWLSATLFMKKYLKYHKIAKQNTLDKKCTCKYIFIILDIDPLIYMYCNSHVNYFGIRNIKKTHKNLKNGWKINASVLLTCSINKRI